jgi:hypothetical protein
MITGDPYLSCRARTAAAGGGGGGGGGGAAGSKGGELCVVLDSARLAQWGGWLTCGLEAAPGARAAETCAVSLIGMQGSSCFCHLILNPGLHPHPP